VELKGKREKFCQAYIYETNENAAAAARLAGYSERRAKQTGSDLVTNRDVQARIRELRLEALRESGYDKDKVRNIIASRLAAIVDTRVTDVVHISSGPDDPNRQETLDMIAKLNGGQRVLDFGDMLIVPTLGLSPDAQAAVKSIKLQYDHKGRYLSPDIELHDPIQAGRTLAQMLGIGAGENNVNINLNMASQLEAARKRVAQSARAGETAEERQEGGNSHCEPDTDQP
jgi:hypothetical protein